MRLHFDKSNGIFSIRRDDRSTVVSSERHGKIPRFIGQAVLLGPSVHILITKGSFIAATHNERPVLPVVVTKWPRISLLVARLKEIIND